MGVTSEWLRSRPHLYLGIAPLVLLLFLPVILSTGVLDGLENLTVDWRFQQRASRDPDADPRLLLVKIDQFSLTQLGAWPWSRALHGDFCSLLAPADPSVVAFDILFTEPRDPPADDQHLAEGMAKPRAVVSGAMFTHDKIPPEKNWGKTAPLTHIEGDISQIGGAEAALYPIPAVRQASLFAFVNSDPTSADGIRRRLPLVGRVGRDVFPGLSLQILCQYWKVPPDQVRIRLGHDIELPTPDGLKSIPIDAHGEMWVNYRNKNSFTAVSYAELAGALFQHEVKQQPLPPHLPAIAGKILLVGQTEPGLSDMGPSPLDAQSPLVMVHMNALDNILRGDYLRIVPVLPIALGWLALSWLTLFYLNEKSILFSVLVPTVCIGLYLVAATVAFAKDSLLLPIAWPVALFVAVHAGSNLLRWLKEQQSRQQIRDVFASYIAPGVMERLLKHPENIRLGGVRQPVTTLFSDIRGFTTFSETVGEVELVFQLNEYFEKMVGCVNRYRGTLHKYIGDAVMAAWGDVIPETPAADAARAVRSALAMRAELILLNEGWAAQNRTQFKIGIGLNHGNVLVGNIGAVQRREFTLIGDAVNVASRLEGVTKEYRTDIAIGESLHDLVHDQFLMRTVGLIQVKGKKQGLRVFEVLDDLQEPLGLWPADWVARYEQGIQAYLSRQFAEAYAIFETCLQERPNDFCSQLYLERCSVLFHRPPPEDWDGTHIMETK
jgi:adenylate cyclase